MLSQFALQLLILIKFLIKHHRHAADLDIKMLPPLINRTTYFFFEFLVLIAHMVDTLAHLLELCLLLHAALFGRLPVLLEPMKQEVRQLRLNFKDLMSIS